MRRDTVSQGRLGETIAAAYLELAGYRVLARNQRDGPREIDLVATAPGFWVVVEVRLRRSTAHGRAEETIAGHKRRDLLRAGRSLWLRDGREHGRLRFDLVTLEPRPGGLALRHFPNFLSPESM